ASGLTAPSRSRLGTVQFSSVAPLEQFTIGCSHRCAAPDSARRRRRAKCMWNYTLSEPDEVWRCPPQADVATPNRELLYPLVFLGPAIPLERAGITGFAGNLATGKIAQERAIELPIVKFFDAGLGILQRPARNA